MSSEPYPAEKETPLAYRAVRGGLWVVAGSYWQIGVGFLANIFLTRILFPEAFGSVALAMFFAQLLRLQPRLGLGRAFAQDKDSDGRSVGTYLLLETTAALLSLALGLLAVPVLLWLQYGQTVAWICVALLVAGIVESFSGVGSVILDKELRFAQASLVQVIAFPLSYVPAFWLALRGAGPWSLVAQTVTFNLLSMLGIWTLLGRSPILPALHTWRFDKTLAGRYLRFGVTVGAVTLIGMLLTHLDNFYIGTFVDARELGYYDRAYRLAQWPALLMNALLTRAAFYTYARLQGDVVRLRRTAEMVLWLVITVSMPVLLALVITAPDLLTFLYTARWLPSTLFLRILVLFALVRPLMMNANTFFIAIGKPGLTARYNLVQLAVLAIAGYPLTLHRGALGTSVAVGMMLAAGVALSYRRMAREIGVNLLRFLLPPAAIALLILALYWWLNRNTGLTALPLPLRVVLKGLYAFLAFGLGTLALQPRSTRERLRYVWRLLRQEE
ncbi:MAG: polysaccharide biosynthesis protein [Caldilineae bacterium]|nr:MAG: polysaccharide biosynthesis protein [Caldilineae bacterium]